jgi:hypothetical protein
MFALMVANPWAAVSPAGGIAARRAYHYDPLTAL